MERELEAKRHRGPLKPIPPKDVRTDGVDHDEKDVLLKTDVNITVALCHPKGRNCFAAFHSK